MEPACNQARIPSGMDSKKAKELSEPLKQFYRGEPLALGITQLLLGINGVVFSLMLHVAYEDVFYFPYFIMMAPYWTAVPFIISGLLSVGAARRPNPSLVKIILGMNVVSAVTAGLAMITLSLSLTSGPWNLRHQCGSSGTVDLVCYLIGLIPFNIACGVIAVLLVFAIVEFCISLSSASFGCMTLCRDTFTEKVTVVYQSAPPVNEAHLPVVHQNIPPYNAFTLPAASEDAENLLSGSLSGPPPLPPLAPSSEAQGLDEPGPVDQTGSGDTVTVNPELQILKGKFLATQHRLLTFLDVSRACVEEE